MVGSVRLSSRVIGVREVRKRFLLLTVAGGASSMVAPVAAVSGQRVATVPPPAHAEANAPRISLDAENVTIVTALTMIGRQAGLMPLYDSDLIPSARRVSIHIQSLPVQDAFAMVLRGTGLVAQIGATGSVVIAPGSAVAKVGTIIGRVLAEETKQPLRGVSIVLDNATRGIQTGEDGTFRLAGVSAGTHTVTARLLGRGKQQVVVQVGDEQVVAVDFVLPLTASALDQVVVTGMVIPTELKAVPNAITVVTAKQIEQRGITRIEQLFHGDVPGIFAQNQGSGALLDEVTMFSRGATALSGNSAGVSGDFLTNPIKTYVDGVELADPKYLSQIDPKSIERIEILTGPQASTIYGSNAINGVMQIFTKRGTSATPQLSFSLLSGFVQNNFNSALTPQHDYSTRLNGIEGRVSYNAGGSWNYIGPWTPAKQTTRTNGFGGARLDVPTSMGRVTADMMLRRSLTQNWQRGSPVQVLTRYGESGYYRYDGNTSGLITPTRYVLLGQTLGLTLGYVPTSWWSHEFGLGQDLSNYEQRSTTRGYQNRSDTTLFFQQNYTDRHSLRYATTVRVPVTSMTQLTAVVGVDAWRNVFTSWSVSPQTLTGSLTGSTTISRQPGHNTGGFLQTQFGVKDQLFLTYGLRAEWNPNFGADAQPNYAPRYGIAYAQQLGALTAKLRGSYGRATRPPQSTFKAAQTIGEAWGSSWSSVASAYLLYYGDIFNSIFIFANPDLAPEYQQGGEGGLDVYFGSRGSLMLTRYNQTVDGLIDFVRVDSIRSLAPNPTYYDAMEADGYGYSYQFQYLNIGTIRNQGWEMQGTLNTGPITTRGTYSWTKSRTIGVDPKFRALFSPQDYPQYQPGATFQYLPEHTWGVGLAYAHLRTTVALNVSGVGNVPVKNLSDEFYFRNLAGNIRLANNRLRLSSTGYTYINRSYALMDLLATRQLSSRLEGVCQIQNLADHYAHDTFASRATMGRQLMLGIRLR